MSDLDLKFTDLEPRQRYKLLCGLVVPRPIAWVTTLSPEGVVNAAPFSFFNVFSEDPALVVLGVQHKADGTAKDTSRNIAGSGEFVVNVVGEAVAQAMNLTAVDFPSGEGEPASIGLELAPSTLVKPPRLADAPAALECRRTVSLMFGPGRELIVGEVLSVHARSGIVDPATLSVDFDALRPVGRLAGSGYARQGDRFDMRRLTHAEWRAKRDGS